MANQSDRQAAIRGVTSTTLTYEGDWHALWDDEGIASGTFSERMLTYINNKLSVSYTNINDAMYALAADQGAGSWDQLGTFTPGAVALAFNDEGSAFSSTTEATRSVSGGGKGVVIVYIEESTTGPATVSASWAGDAMTQINRADVTDASGGSGFHNRIVALYVDDCAAGTLTVTLSTSEDFGIYAFRVTGAADGQPEFSSVNTGQATTLIQSASPASSESLIVTAGGAAPNTVTFTSDNGATEVADFATTGTNTMRCTLSRESRTDTDTQLAKFTASGTMTRGVVLTMVFGKAGTASVTPLSYFADGENGGFWDPSDASTVFQERTGLAATTASAADDVIGTILDKSGNGHHATALSDAARPIRRNSAALWYMACDGVDDYLEVDASGLSLAPYNATLANAARLTSTSGSNCPVGLAQYKSGGGVNQAYAPVAEAGNNWLYMLGAHGTSDIEDSPLDTNAHVHMTKATNGAVTARKDGAAVTGSGSNANTSAIDSWAIGGDAETWASGDVAQDIFMSFVIDRELSASEIASLESYMAGKAGVSL